MLRIKLNKTETQPQQETPRNNVTTHIRKWCVSGWNSALACFEPQASMSWSLAPIIPGFEVDLPDLFNSMRLHKMVENLCLDYSGGVWKPFYFFQYTFSIVTSFSLGASLSSIVKQWGLCFASFRNKSEASRSKQIRDKETSWCNHRKGLILVQLTAIIYTKSDKFPNKNHLAKEKTDFFANFEKCHQKQWLL